MALSTTKNSSRWKKINECLMLRLTAFLLLFFFSHCSYISTAIGTGSNLTRRGGCIESEMLSLLALKEGIYKPPGNWLSSWRPATDCCSWRGVGCDYSTGHIIKLNLRYPYDWIYENYEDYLPGPSKLNSSSLLGLMHLRHLDLSMNNFYPQPIPEFLGSLVKLQYLNLSNAGFGGSIPPHLGNLSSLRFLDLNFNQLSSVESLDWVSRMTSLEYLDMSMVDLSKTGDNWIHDINMLPSLSVLLLSDATLEKIPYALPQANFTYLTMLDLSGNIFGSTTPNWLFNITTLLHLDLGSCYFSGEIPKNIENLLKLEHLNLGSNNIGGEISETMVSLCKLNYLDLSNNMIGGQITGFVEGLSRCVGGSNLQSLSLIGNKLNGTIPTTFGQLSKLQFLDLSLNSFLGNLTEIHVSNLSKLEFLNLGSNNIEGKIPKTMGSLCKLNSLDLSHNMIGGQITGFVKELSRCAGGSNLQILELKENKLNGTIPTTFGQLSKLQFLDFSSNSFVGNLTEVHVSNLSKLEFLNLGSNNIEGKIPKTMGSLCKLNSLDLSNNMIGGQITGFVEELSRCAGGSNLQNLVLKENKLNGTIPTTFGQLQKLQFLDLSSNSFVGNLTEVHFSNLSNLDWLDLSYNHLEMIFNPSWIPPFNVSVIYMCSCHMGPRFPAWLRTQTWLKDLCISEAGILENIPHWLWDIDITNLNVSYNQINGQLSPSLETRKYSSLDLSSNNFDGQIPNLDPTDLYHLDLSNNSLSGPIPWSLANATKFIRFFSLSNNHLNGSIPPFYFYNLTNLEILDLSNNNFSGNFSDSIGSLLSLRSLHLRNNSLMGNILWSLHHCQQLVVLDVGENRFSGTIPTWIGESLSSLRVLRLRSNSFSGNIPSQISFLTNLQVLDLAYNNLSGILSPSFWNFKAMVLTMKVEKPMLNDSSYQEKILITTKGIEIMYTTVLSLVVSIDLSNNGLCGEINEELSKLHGLQFLNLSKNHFTGKIPENIGEMRQLESLDLSVNNLSGNIPPSISNLNFLERLNLSQNNLSGRIPLGGQLQSLDDPSIYSGNLNLCGWPLQQCPIDGPSRGGKDVQGHSIDKIWLYASVAVGFIIGFWSVIGTLMIKVSLRISFFRIIDRFYDWVYVKLAINIARIKSYGEV